MVKKTKLSRLLCLYMSIGDGYINKNGFLSIRHGESQKEYIEFKRNLLYKNGINVTNVYEVNNNGYKGYEFRTYNHKFLKLYRRILYTPKKDITLKSIWNRMSPLGLAIWYMDDGSLTIQYKNGNPCRARIIISTCLDTIEEHDFIIETIYNKFGVKFSVCKMKGKYALRCGTKEARKFINIVKPFMQNIQCMQYKLNIFSNIESIADYKKLIISK